MSIHDLMVVTKPPKRPVEAGPMMIWESIQERVGIKLPTDFRAFGLTFGTGKFAEQGIVVFNPFAAIFPQWLDESLAVWRTLKRSEGNEEVPFAVYPEPQGLLPWGNDESGTGMFWLTEGSPDEWPVLVRGENPRYHRFQMGLTTFLAKVFTQEIVLPDVWPSSVFKTHGKVVFEPLDVQPKDTRGLRTIFELYMANGMRAGFWVQHGNWEGTADQIRVKSVNGQTEGALTGEPPNYGGGPVLIDVFVNGSLRDENVLLSIATDQGFRMVD